MRAATRPDPLLSRNQVGGGVDHAQHQIGDRTSCVARRRVSRWPISSWRSSSPPAPRRAPCDAVAAPVATPAPRHRRRALADAVGARARHGPDCGTDPVVLNAYFETGFDIPFKLSEEFTKQFPNVTWDIKQDQFTNLMTATPRLLSGDNPPDLIRLPSMVSLVKDGLLKNLDDYATAFGWDQWSAAQLAQNRVADDGTRGSGSLYAMGLNYSMTGVFYNKELATQIGMTAAADDGRRVRGPARRRPRTPGSSRSCSGTPPPAAAGSPSRSRTSWPPTARPSRSTTGSSRSRARRSTRRRT